MAQKPELLVLILQPPSTAWPWLRVGWVSFVTTRLWLRWGVALLNGVVATQREKSLEMCLRGCPWVLVFLPQKEPNEGFLMGRVEQT